MSLPNSPSATASQLLDLYLSLQGFGLVGPADLQVLGIELEQLRNLEMRVPVRWAVHLWERAASRGRRRRSACWSPAPRLQSPTAHREAETAKAHRG